MARSCGAGSPDTRATIVSARATPCRSGKYAYGRGSSPIEKYFERRADDIGAAAEEPLPQTVGSARDRVAARQVVFARRERASDRRRDAEGLRVAVGHLLAPDVFGRVRARERECLGGLGRGVDEHVAQRP